MTVPQPDMASSGGASGVADQAQQRAGEMTDKAKQAAFSQIESQKGKAAQGLNTVASSLRQAGNSMEQSDQGQFAQYVHRAADQVEHLSRSVETRSAEELLGDIEGFARRQPALFLGLAFAAGVAASRFLKSSSRGQTLLDRGSEMARSAASAVSNDGASDSYLSEPVLDPYGRPR